MRLFGLLPLLCLCVGSTLAYGGRAKGSYTKPLPRPKYQPAETLPAQGNVGINPLPGQVPARHQTLPGSGVTPVTLPHPIPSPAVDPAPLPGTRPLPRPAVIPPPRKYPQVQPPPSGLYGSKGSTIAACDTCDALGIRSRGICCKRYGRCCNDF